jgi:hypothetical protein
MAVTITDDDMTSDLVIDCAIKVEEGRWIITGPLLSQLGNRDNGYSRNQAVTAMNLAEHLGTWGNEHWCATLETWHTELTTQDPTDPASKDPGPVRCLYCGSDEVFETLVTIDERTSEYALECADCHGVWAQ